MVISITELRDKLAQGKPFPCPFQPKPPSGWDPDNDPDGDPCSRALPLAA